MTCIACGSPLADRDWLQIPSITLRACPACATLTAVPRPSPQAQAALHDTDSYFSHPYFEKRRSERDLTTRRCHDTFARMAGLVNLTALRGARHLDVGCDTGAFMSAAADAFGVTPVGLDVARRSIDQAQQRGLTAYCASLEEAPAHLGRFSIITAIDLIEHLVDPERFLGHIRERLEPDGLCYVETPNIQSTIYSVGRAVAVAGGGSLGAVARLFPAQHIQYFSLQGLAALAGRSALTLARTGTRVLPRADLGVSFATGCGLAALQGMDTVLQRQIILWAVLRRSASASGR